ncbi:MAG: polysaccharide biosynthesis tyrosine autokinase [Anaerolineaceae bacterium]|nr:polysaccharide biosynthesis tyrosine autokinase [Anaerolineaceae bacterium]
MEIKKFFLILRRRKWVVITTVLVTMLLVVLGTWMMSPTYTATATLRIATAAASSYNYSDYMFADRLITTYINISTSRPLLDELNKQLGLSKAPTINVQQIPNSELIQISVEDHNPNLAMRAANTLGSILISQGGEFFTGDGKTPADVLKVQVDKAEADLNQVQANYYARLSKNPNDTAGNQAAAKVVDLQQQLYFSLLTQYQQMIARVAIQSNIISFVETASFPVSPSKPNKMLNIVLGLIISLIGGIGLAFLFENVDTIIYSPEEINTIAHLRSLGRIPASERSEQLTPTTDGKSPFSEAISRLRTNFLILIQDPPKRTLLVTSASRGEGKTVVASNLAFALAKAGKSVILIDCDLRIPSIHTIFNLENNIGLSDYLEGKAILGEIIQETGVKSLHVITAGQTTDDPALLLDSLRMKALIPGILTAYDIILFDAPAVLAVTDSIVLAPLVESVILVARLGITQKEKLSAALEQLNNVKAKIVGIVVNGDESSNHKSYYSHKVTPFKGEKVDGART